MSKKQKQYKFYDVTMRVEVKRRVLATSQGDARDKVDTSDMVYEIKNYGFDEEIFVKEDTTSIPDEYDLIDAIGEQIVQNSNWRMHLLKEQYAEIRKINEQLVNAGKKAYEPRIFNRMTDSFLDRLRS